VNQCNYNFFLKIRQKWLLHSLWLFLDIHFFTTSLYQLCLFFFAKTEFLICILVIFIVVVIHLCYFHLCYFLSPSNGNFLNASASGNMSTSGTTFFVSPVFSVTHSVLHLLLLSLDVRILITVVCLQRRTSESLAK
jgi:hypothetical protein